jgi:adenosylhomocysteine nucleosidase
VSVVSRRQVIVLAPMPLEMDAIVTAFGLRPTSDAAGAPAEGRVGDADVTAVHIGMGPELTRAALHRVLDDAERAGRRIDHVMNAGICGGLDPDLPVGALLNPETVVLHSTGAAYEHRPPGQEPRRGTLITTDGVFFDREQSLGFFADGCLGVDMESAAVAEVCEARGYPWSIYRCIGDRHFDVLLDERIVAMANPDGSGNAEEITRLLKEEPEIVEKLEQLARDSALAAQRAAEAAMRGCLALDA